MEGSLCTLLSDGRRPVHAAKGANGSELAVEFLEKLSASDHRRMLFLFAKVAEGRRLIKEDFRCLKGGIYEFKDYQNRMLCFSTPAGWFVTHGFSKKTSANTPPAEITRAMRIREEHLRAQKVKK